MLLLSLINLSSASDIMFVGNSYTSSNNLPSLVQGLLEEGLGSAVQTSALTGGGLKFVDHLNRSQNNGTWSNGFSSYHDWVLFQEQSQVPGFPQNQASWIDSRDAFVSLDDLVEAQGGQSMLLMTWGRRDGDSMNTWLYPDFETMQELLKEGYLSYMDTASSSTRKVWVAPMGLGFANIKIHHPTLFSGLYSGDGSHPSYDGSYLAACIVYSSLTGYSPVGLTAGAPSNANTYQEVAEMTVLEDPFGEIPYPWAWTELPTDGYIFAENMHPYLRYNEDSAIDIVVENARIDIEGGHIEGSLQIASNAKANLLGGAILGDIDGDLSMTGGRLESTYINGSLQQSDSGSIVLRDLTVTQSAQLSNITFTLPEDQSYGRLTAVNLSIQQPIIDEDLFWNLDEETGTFELWREDPTQEPTEEPASEPTDEPTEEPTSEPTDEPTEEPPADSVEAESDIDSNEKSGCQHAQSTTPLAWLSVLLLALRRRTKKPNTKRSESLVQY
ncbi:MAG: PT domain-containing protein [Myxococcota bacterium]|nr:PT domain-containing protein [Myxococcota bacterium]